MKDFHDFFPIPLALLPESHRQAVQDFYGFIAHLEGICNDPTLPREEKRQQLRLLRLTLQEHNTELLPEWALGYLILCDQERLSPQHGENLWQSFWQSTEQSHFRTMAEILAWSRLASAPIGRGVLEILEENEADPAATDALCMALHLVHLLQQTRRLYMQEQQVILPTHLLEAAGISEKVLEKNEAGPKLRVVIALWLDEVDSLLQHAAPLAASIKNSRLRGQIKMIQCGTVALSKKIRKGDVMAGKIRLSGWEQLLASLRSL
jgi:phytoene/squalene synthetase